MIHASRTAQDARRNTRTLGETDVLDRATDLMWRDGPNARSLNELAAALGVSKPALSKMFGDKAQFQAAVLRRYHERVGAHDAAGLAWYLYGQSVALAFLSRTEAAGDELRAFRDRSLAGIEA